MLVESENSISDRFVAVSTSMSNGNVCISFGEMLTVVKNYT
jgi:hypothetical protein